MNRLRSVSSAVVGFLAVACGVARAEAPATDHRFFARLAPGVAYLRESWSPSGKSPGAVFSGLGPSLELSIGKRVRPRLVVGGLWQLVAISDPTESYLGTASVEPGTARALDVVAAFADFYPNPRRGFHVGGSAGLLAASILDRQCCLDTHWGGALSVRVGYDLILSRRWSAGALAQLEAFRYWASEASVSSASTGLVPALAFVFTFDRGR